MTTYFVDESLHVAADGRLVLLHQRNRSSHRDPRPYDVRVHDRTAGTVRDLGEAQRIPAPDAQLLERRPVQVFPAARAPRALLHFQGYAGEAVLRLVELDSGKVLAEQRDANHVPHALDGAGRQVLLADYPFQSRWAVLDLETGATTAAGAFPPGLIFGRRAAWGADAWWLTLQDGRKHLLGRLPAAGGTIETMPLPAAPWGLSTGGDAVAVGLGTDRVGVLRGGKLTVSKPFPDAPAKSAVEVQLSPDGGRLLARASLLEAMQAVKPPGPRRGVPIAEEAWDDDLLLRLPGIACLPDGDLVCRSRLLTWFPAD